jgi:hypothetical protein
MLKSLIMLVGAFLAFSVSVWGHVDEKLSLWSMFVGIGIVVGIGEGSRLSSNNGLTRKRSIGILLRDLCITAVAGVTVALVFYVALTARQERLTRLLGVIAYYVLLSASRLGTTASMVASGVFAFKVVATSKSGDVIKDEWENDTAGD